MSFRRRYGGYGRSYGYGGGFSTLAMLRQFEREMEREREREEERAAQLRLAELRRLAGDSRRRQVEIEIFGRFTPAGVWDANFEKWPEASYTWPLGGGFIGAIKKSLLGSFNGYVTLPDWFPDRLASKESWTRHPMRPPVHKEFTYSQNGTLGWDHTWGGDLCAFGEQSARRQAQIGGRPVVEPVVGPNWGPHCFFSTAEMVIEEVWRVASWFASLALDGQIAVPAGTITPEIREGLFKVQQGEMRIAERKRKERAAAAAARAEAERVAAEAAAALAAAEAERQRLYDLEHPEEAAHRAAIARSEQADAAAAKAARLALDAARDAQDAADELRIKKGRVPRIHTLLAEIEKLQEREENGETLSAAEKRQMKRYADLKVELSWKQKLTYVKEKADYAQKKALADELEAKSKEAAALAEAAQAEKEDARVAVIRAAEEAERALVAAAVAKAAAEKAAEDAKLLAAEKELKQKRLAHVEELIKSIESLKARRAAGEKLDPLQGKKIGRLAALVKELAQLKTELALFGGSAAS